MASQLDLLTAEENKLDADNDLALSDANVAVNLITLYRALGENIDGPKPAPMTPALAPAPIPAAQPVSYENGVMVIQ